MRRLYLSIPTKEDIWLKKKCNEDPTSMDYNAGYNVNLTGYNYNN